MKSVPLNLSSPSAVANQMVPDESCCMSTTALYDIPFLTENWVSLWRINESWPDVPYKESRNSVNVKSVRFIICRFSRLAGCFSVIDTNL